MRILSIFAIVITLFVGLSINVYAAEPVQAQQIRVESTPPADLVQMFKDSSAAMISMDMDKIMSFYSDHYLSEGQNKDAHRKFLDTWVFMLSNYEIKLTHFAAITDDHAYIAADIVNNFGKFEKTFDYQVIKEDGQWKWFGYQR